MTPLRILLVTKSTGGVAEYVRQLALGLDSADFELTVACLSENGPEFAAELRQVAGVKAFSLQMNRYKVDPWSDAQVCLALARHLRRERYDLVHAHASKPGFLTRLAALGTGLPVLYSPHCFAFHAGANPVSARLVAVLEAFAARFLTTRIVTVADGERKLARQYGVGPDELFVTVPTGLDPRPYRQPVDQAALKASLNLPVAAPLVGTVGRLSDQKAPLDYVRMAALVHQQLPEVQFAWVGSGPLAEAAPSSRVRPIRGSCPELERRTGPGRASPLSRPPDGYSGALAGFRLFCPGLGLGRFPDCVARGHGGGRAGRGDEYSRER